jgi:hypothetical protein
VQILGPLDASSTSGLTDGNEFRCNSAPASGSFTGGDVRLDTPSSGAVTIALDGNSRDHAAPTVSRTGSMANGADVVLASSAPPAVAAGAPGAAGAAARRTVSRVVSKRAVLGGVRMRHCARDATGAGDARRVA